MKQLLNWVFGYDNEYTKREMALFTRIVIVLLLFIIFIFFALFIAHMKFGMSQGTVKIFWQYYLVFTRWLITAYSVAWIGQMGKAFLAKREEERNNLQRELANNTDFEEDNYEECNDDSTETEES